MHSWQWELEAGEQEGSAVMIAREPRGWAYAFKQSASGDWDAVSPTIQNKLSQEGDGVALQLANKARVQLEYNRFGQISRTVDPAGIEETIIYDSLGRKTEQTRGEGEATHTGYAPIGSIAPADKAVNITSPMGRVTRMTYDAKGQLIAETKAAGTDTSATTRMAYDAAGRLISRTGPRGNTTLYDYDVRGRRITTTSALNHTTRIEYDAASRKLSQTDPKGNTTHWSYDSLGRLLSATDALDQTINYTYNAMGRLISLTDPHGNTHQFEYDAIGNQTALIYPDSSSETSSYDKKGLRLTYTNRAGVTQTFSYDNRDREIASAWSDGTQTISKAYDPAGRTTSQNNGISNISFTYNDNGRLASETQDITAILSGGFDPEPRTLNYTYTLDGQRETLAYPDGRILQFSYDGQGRLSEVIETGSDTPLAQYEYDSAGNATRMPRQNTATTKQTFDSENKLVLITDSYGQHNTLLNQLEYTYDEVGNRTATQNTLPANNSTAVTREDSYLYDDIDQVIGVDYGAEIEDGRLGVSTSSIRFSYDALGNRIEVNEDGAITRYTANELNQYVAIDEFAPTYDPNGNLSGMGEWLYTYDSLKRLVSASNGQANAQIGYDARNRAVVRSYQETGADTTTITYNTYDRWNLVEERDSTGAMQTQYVHGSRLDELLVITNAHGLFYPHQDVLENVSLLTDSEGKLAERYSYSVEGEVIIYNSSGETLPKSAVGNRWFFTGREYWGNLGLYDYRNRVYSSRLGRFLQTDPVRFQTKDLNLYRYVKNSYLNYTDPYGEAWLNWDHDAEEYQLGRDNSWIKPDTIVTRFIEDNVPAAHTFAQKHDAFVDYTRDEMGYPDLVVNIPSMPFIYVIAVFDELEQSINQFLDYLFDSFTE